jgi:hypothetical protein
VTLFDLQNSLSGKSLFDTAANICSQPLTVSQQPPKKEEPMAIDKTITAPARRTEMTPIKEQGASLLSAIGNGVKLASVNQGGEVILAMAEKMFAHQLAQRGLAGAVRVSSAGTGDWHTGAGDDARAVRVLRERGYPTSHSAAQVGDDHLAADLVVALGRNHLGINTFENFIQTDAAINPGNSGGALVDTNGHLLGINNVIYTRSGGSLGIGFAIPVTTVKTVMDAIIRNGQVVRGWIGVEPQDITPELAENFGLQKSTGTIIAGVLRGGPADKAGVKPGDILLSVADKPVSDTVSMLNLVAQLTPGEKVRLTVLRKSSEAAIDITVGRRPRSKPRRPMESE